jgi:hypothetical protein
LVDKGAKADALHHASDVYLLQENGIVLTQLCVQLLDRLLRNGALC